MNLIGFTAKSYSCTPSNLQKPHKSILAALRHRWFGVFLRPTSFVPICPCPHLWVPMQKSSALAADPWISTSPGKRTIPSHDEQSPLPTQSSHFLMRSHSEMNPVQHLKLIRIPGRPALVAKLFQHEITIRALYVSISAIHTSQVYGTWAKSLPMLLGWNAICNIPPARAAR